MKLIRSFILAIEVWIWLNKRNVSGTCWITPYEIFIDLNKSVKESKA